MENFSDAELAADKSVEKKEWSTPELVILPKNIIKGSSDTGNDGGGTSTAS
jgi:hypothetical protein